MKPFRFRLESVLKYREFMEKKAMMHLMRQQKVRDEIQVAIGQLATRRSELAAKSRQAGEDGAEAYLIRSWAAYMDSLKDDIEKRFEELFEQDGRIREAESALKKETTRKKVLERLRELKLEEYRQMSAKMEQTQLDELAINRRGLVYGEGVL